MDGASAANSKWRLESYMLGIRIALQNPFGVGFGPPAASAFLDDVFDDYHNSPLSIWVRTGFTGFFTFLAINAVFYYRCVKFCLDTEEVLYRAYMIGILCGHVSMFINSLFFMVLQVPYMGVFYWIFMGIGIALINLSKNHQILGSRNHKL